MSTAKPLPVPKNLPISLRKLTDYPIAELHQVDDRSYIYLTDVVDPGRYELEWEIKAGMGQVAKIVRSGVAVGYFFRINPRHVLSRQCAQSVVVLRSRNVVPDRDDPLELHRLERRPKEGLAVAVNNSMFAVSPLHSHEYVPSRD